MSRLATTFFFFRTNCPAVGRAGQKGRGRTRPLSCTQQNNKRNKMQGRPLTPSHLLTNRAPFHRVLVTPRHEGFVGLPRAAAIRDARVIELGAEAARPLDFGSTLPSSKHPSLASTYGELQYALSYAAFMSTVTSTPTKTVLPATNNLRAPEVTNLSDKPTIPSNRASLPLPLGSFHVFDTLPNYGLSVTRDSHATFVKQLSCAAAVAVAEQALTMPAAPTNQATNNPDPAKMSSLELESLENEANQSARCTRPLRSAKSLADCLQQGQINRTSLKRQIMHLASRNAACQSREISVSGALLPARNNGEVNPSAACALNHRTGVERKASVHALMLRKSIKV